MLLRHDAAMMLPLRYYADDMPHYAIYAAYTRRRC